MLTLDSKETSKEIQEVCRTIISYAAALFTVAGDTITLEAQLKDGRKISVEIKEITDEQETNDKTSD